MKLKALTNVELRILSEVYPVSGTRGVCALLPHRTPGTVSVMAHRRGIKVALGARRVFSDDAIAAALAANDCNVRLAAVALGCCRMTIRNSRRRIREQNIAAARSRRTAGNEGATA